MNELRNKTLSQIVTEHYQAAPIFEKYGLDFCCKGKRALETACTEKEIKLDAVLEDLDKVIKASDKTSPVDQMSLSELCAYIVRVHHGYTKLHLPQIHYYLLRVAEKHGENFPYMKEVYALFSELHKEMEQHMIKEEQVLFPRIEKMVMTGSVPLTGWLSDPIGLMEQEHDGAGTIMEKIRQLTNDYQPPAQACTTFRLSLAALQAFEADLHQHVHLENNMLFPKAIAFLETGNCCTRN